MRLTPADVHNVAFSKPPIGKRGYNEDEVDQFLDFVEAELARLIDENANLTARVGELDAELSQARAAVHPTASTHTPQQSAHTQVLAGQSANYASTIESSRTTGHSEEEANARAARVLALAQDTADRVTATARSESEVLLNDSRVQADSIVAEAQAKADSMLVDARQRSEAILADAQTRAESQLRQAAERSESLQADAERKHSEIMSTISRQRGVLEGRIEQLKTYEREYRTRLKTYLESQLEELEQRGSAAPVDGGREATTDPGSYTGSGQY